MPDNQKNLAAGWDSTPEDDGVTIADTASTTGTINLGRKFFAVRVECPDSSNVQASTTMSFKVAGDSNASLTTLMKLGGTEELVTGNLPNDSDGFSFALPDAVGIQRIECVLSKAASGGTVVINVIGIDGGKGIVT